MRYQQTNGYWIATASDEILADPDPTSGDANGDGVVSSTQDEFVELVNVSGSSLDISGWTLSDASGVRHTFPPGSVVCEEGVMVVFAGGTPSGTSGCRPPVWANWA